VASGATRAIRLQLQPLLRAAEARARDRHTIDALGVPGLVLMEHAGRAVADVVGGELARRPGSVLVVCGAGNNGGDGHVCARHLLARGVDVVVVSSVDPARLTGDAATAATLLSRAAAHLGHPGIAVGELPARIAGQTPAVIVDALFGTGLSRPLDDDGVATVVAIDALRDRGAVVVAVDIPSGLPCDGQAPAGPTVRADVTVTFGGRKVAHHAEPGRERCGRVIDVDLGFIPPPDEAPGIHRLVGVDLPAVDVTAHKGRFGHVGVIVGRPGLGGAAVLSATSALRAGAGLVTLIGDVDVTRPVEVMAATADDEAALQLDALVVGPGLSTRGGDGDAAVCERVRRLRAAAVADGRTLWTVADAGALGVLHQGDADVWTPHPGEAARVLASSVADVQRDRLAAARALVDRLGGVVVLKGHAPIVATAARAVVIDGDTPALAVAGSGDVLAGLIAAGLGGALGPGTVDDIVGASVWLHQQAGAGEARGLLASELAARLRGVIAGARRG
jgi:NAD(P)H-hydrate epimerase